MSKTTTKTPARPLTDDEIKTTLETARKPSPASVIPASALEALHRHAHPDHMTS